MRSILAVGLLAAVLGVSVRADEVTRLAVGETLPPLEGDFLTKTKARLPDAAAGKVALVSLGFTYDSRFAVEEWSNRFRETFADEPRVTFFEVPMLGRMARLGRVFIDRGMRSGTPEAFHGNVITVYGGSVGDWKKRMGFTDATKNAAYLILVGPDGVVRWLHTGVPADAPFEALVASTRELLPSGL